MTTGEDLVFENDNDAQAYATLCTSLRALGHEIPAGHPLTWAEYNDGHHGGVDDRFCAWQAYRIGRRFPYMQLLFDRREFGASLDCLVNLCVRTVEMWTRCQEILSQDEPKPRWFTLALSICLLFAHTMYDRATLRSAQFMVFFTRMVSELGMDDESKGWTELHKASIRELREKMRIYASTAAMAA